MHNFYQPLSVEPIPIKNYTNLNVVLPLTATKAYSILRRFLKVSFHMVMEQKLSTIVSCTHIYNELKQTLYSASLNCNKIIFYSE